MSELDKARRLAQEARAWVASPEGEESIKRALAEAQAVTDALNEQQRRVDWRSLLDYVFTI
ncbi:hypothetical protein [Pantanalinema sp. GBBB05]|uniref:hypothetical protein n=1 Tax=Pantanalinema sp. GBBB05 TaxID=2604139 RepID=UPI001D973627|nr:hypothetical protein [Pantanalinema sp. GBBB05]